MLHSGSIECFRRIDEGGLGLVTPTDFVEGMKELGYDFLGSNILHGMASLFDYREVVLTNGQVVGGVDYGNFIAFALEQEGSLRLRQVEAKLRAAVTHARAQEDALDLRTAFAEFDIMDQGVVTQAQFSQVLDDMGYNLTDDEKRVLFSRVDAKRNGVVHYDDFVMFVEMKPSPRPLSYEGLWGKDFDELAMQLKGRIYFQDAAQKGISVSNYGKAFAHYDWKHKGIICARAFIKAAKRIGLTYTLPELRQITEYFSVSSPVGDDFDVYYRKFLGWIMGEGEGAEKKGALPLFGETIRDIGKGGGAGLALLKELRKKWIKEGLDYRAVFERYDEDLKGYISKKEFQAALKELDVDIDEADFERLEMKFSVHGKVSYLHLLHSLKEGSSDEESRNSWELEEDLRRMIRRRFQYWTPGKMREPFLHFCVSSKTSFSEAEFGTGMKALGFLLPLEQEHVLFSKMDLDQSGSISYPDFVIFVRDPNFREVADKFTRRLRKLKVGVKEFRQVLDEFEEGDTIGIKVFKKTLDMLGFDMPSKDYDRCAARFDLAEEREVSVDALLKFIKGYEEPDSESDEVRALQDCHNFYCSFFKKSV